MATDKRDATTNRGDLNLISLIRVAPPLTRPALTGRQGVDFQIREMFESALVLGREAAIALGAAPEDADAVVADVRSRDRDRFALQSVEGIFAGRDLLQGNSQQMASGH